MKWIQYGSVCALQIEQSGLVQSAKCEINVHVLSRDHKSYVTLTSGRIGPVSYGHRILRADTVPREAK